MVGRPCKWRHIAGRPESLVFKPRGIPACGLDWIYMELDEFEALRLVDCERLYQEEAAKRMGVSRQTLGSILSRAREKSARCIVEGKALRIAARPASTKDENHENRDTRH